MLDKVGIIDNEGKNEIDPLSSLFQSQMKMFGHYTPETQDTKFGSEV